jgi:hypothetical protein
MAIKYMYKSPALINFSILAKSVAAVFLVIYYFFIERDWMIVVSAFGDAIMASVLYLFYKRFQIINSK